MNKKSLTKGLFYIFINNFTNLNELNYSLCYNNIVMKIEDGIFKRDKYEVFYRLVGDFKEDSIPLVILHGGPGGNFSSYEVLYKLADKGIHLLLYNQHGSYKSTIYNEKDYDELFTIESYMEELEAILAYLNIKKYHLLGHSWGGMLALQYILDKKDKNMQSLILFSTLPSSKLWGIENLRLIRYYPKKTREEIIKNKDDGSYTSLLLKRGIKKFMKEHNGDKSRRVYINKEKKVKFLGKSYQHMWGKSEIVSDGTLKDWDVTDRLKEIKIRTLIISGQEDESTPYINKVMNDEIPNSKWVLLRDSQHCGYVQEPELVINTLINWIKK